MRIASRVIGVVLAVTGVAFFAVAISIVIGSFDRRSVLAPRTFDKNAWIAGTFCVGLGIVLLLAGWYFLKLDPDKPAESRRHSDRLVAYLVPRRRELRMAAQIGLVLSVIQLAGASFGVKLMARWVFSALSFGSVAMIVIAAQMGEDRTLDRIDWGRVPARMRSMSRIVWHASSYMVLILGIQFVWSQWRHQRFPATSAAGLSAIFFFWAAMYFAYGRVRQDNGTVA
jgi:hypothetical protein